MKVGKRLLKASENENQSSDNWINTESPKPRKKLEEWSSSKQEENEQNLFASLRSSIQETSIFEAVLVLGGRV